MNYFFMNYFYAILVHSVEHVQNEFSIKSLIQTHSDYQCKYLITDAKS